LLVDTYRVSGEIPLSISIENVLCNEIVPLRVFRVEPAFYYLSVIWDDLAFLDFDADHENVRIQNGAGKKGEFLGTRDCHGVCAKIDQLAHRNPRFKNGAIVDVVGIPGHQY
jgi:hypothetical protein